MIQYILIWLAGQIARYNQSKIIIILMQKPSKDKLANKEGKTFNWK